MTDADKQMPIRCPRKKDCVIAWPENCPAWDRWECPVDEDKGQSPKAEAVKGGHQ